MMKAEFEKLVGKTVADEEYEIIEKVYTWHPSISNTNGKEQMVYLYKKLGILVIKEMEETADLCKEIDDMERVLKNQLENLKARKQRIANGEIEIEKCIKEVRNAFDSTTSLEAFEKRLEKVVEKYGKELVEAARKETKM